MSIASGSRIGLIFTSEPMSHVPLMRDRMKPSFGEKFIVVISSIGFETRGILLSETPAARSSLRITDSALRFIEIRVRRLRPDDRRHRVFGRSDLADARPLVDAPRPFHDDPGDVDLQRNELLLGQLVIEEMKVALFPQKDVVDLFLGL